METMQNKLIPLIEKIGQEKGYSLIVGKQFTIWRDPKFDITEEVIKRFNEAQASARAADAKEAITPIMPAFDINAILRALPHRYPFLLVDRILEYEREKRIVGIKNVTINEPFFRVIFQDVPLCLEF